MRGYPELNFPAFHDAADRFRRAGFHVLNPVEIGREAFGQDSSIVPPSEFLRADIRWLLDCDAIALLRGWERSTGAKCEAAVALAVGFTFYNAATMEQTDPPTPILVGGYTAEPASPDAASVSVLRGDGT